jgi:hypothetical protein
MSLYNKKRVQHNKTKPNSLNACTLEQQERIRIEPEKRRRSIREVERNE